MGRLSLNKRIRVVTLYKKNYLHHMKYRFRIFKRLASNEDIFASEKTLRRIVKHYLSTGAVTNKKS